MEGTQFPLEAPALAEEQEDEETPDEAAESEEPVAPDDPLLLADDEEPEDEWSLTAALAAWLVPRLLMVLILFGLLYIAVNSLAVLF